MKRKIIIAIIFVFVAIQFFRIDKSVPEFDEAKDFIAMNNPDNKIKELLINTCYDCHSYETKYPWYSEVAPISWWTKHHVNEGREELNFSTWGNYSAKKADHKLDECIEEIEEGEMPLKSYTIIHGDSDLCLEDKELLTDFFYGLRDFSSDDEEHDHVH